MKQYLKFQLQIIWKRRFTTRNLQPSPANLGSVTFPDNWISCEYKDHQENMLIVNSTRVARKMPNCSNLRRYIIPVALIVEFFEALLTFFGNLKLSFSYEPNDVQILNMTQLESASKTQTAQYRAPRPRLHLPKKNSHELIRCNGDVHVTVINSKTKINGCNGSREDGNILGVVSPRLLGEMFRISGQISQLVKFCETPLSHSTWGWWWPDSGFKVTFSHLRKMNP